MKRPLAKYRLIANDVASYLENNTDMTRSDITLLTPHIRYTANLPSTYNILTDRPTDVVNGVSFVSQIELLDLADEALVGFDYVLVNPDETQVDLTVDIYASGSDYPVASTAVIQVPLLRGHVTTVKGPFLTSNSKGGVTIDPAFEGEFDIIIE